MTMKQALVITSIASPNAVLRAYADACRKRDTDYIVIGDSASPPDFAIPGCDFWSLDRQQNHRSHLAKIAPVRHYSRKNVGYLIAMERRADIIIETDDDNLPLDSFWMEKSRQQQAYLIEEGGWINVYRYFSDGFIWPRGYPLEHVRDSHPPLTGLVEQTLDCPIQQGLADENPDVDAVYRLVFPLPQSFPRNLRIALGGNTCCPFNSQNTVWFKEAFPLMYLPSYCSFRMTDIWRSFVAQRICRENGWHLLFYPPTVRQDRNQHDLLKDFSDEVTGYLGNATIWRLLEQVGLHAGVQHIPDNLIKLYDSLAAHHYVERAELDLLDAWLTETTSG